MIKPHFLWCILAAWVPCKAQDCDLLIRNAKIIDGTGNSWYHGDLAVKDGRILQTGRLPSTLTAKRTIDASGLVAAPGFIDVHTHIEGDDFKIPTRIISFTTALPP
ncbi:hypothetical protein [Chitinophaga cymbidii]|uniref:Amidohydrolase 3 domain-containing protein n=1 Tax=Chitinophaga cymbidii TaxID=1096750 RepID=A0A512RHA7_9BACT|nr:hypothetical protein [Chitinophaga cymbidii]GEP95083.1 hypothetical protein CCY01nite_13430 [Chitinophaga cymbidii]